MSDTLRIALIQQHASDNHQENLDRAIASTRQAAKHGARLVAFAELAFTQFYPQTPARGDVRNVAETIPGPTTDVFCKLARDLNLVMVVNLFEKADEGTFDSSPVINSDGSIMGITRMVHIIEAPCFHEQGYYTPGNTGARVYETDVGKIGIAICYDRHYPEYMRALALKNAELVVVPQAGAVSEWPAGLFEAELQVAGFQNGYFTALCNRVGKEECVEFEGRSFVTAPDGQIIAQAEPGIDQILYADLDFSLIPDSHARRHFLVDRRPDEIF